MERSLGLPSHLTAAVVHCSQQTELAAA